MREILFRGKRVDTKEWVYGDLYQEKFPFKNEIKQVMIVEYRPDLCLVSGANDLNTYWREVIADTVGQFTGLLDKQGKKIFESDFVKSGDDVMVVSWNNQFASFCLDKDGWAFSHWFGESCNPQNVEVIGNIHNTPK